MGRRGITRQELLIAGAGAYTALLLGGCGSSGRDAQEITFWNGFTGGDGPTMLELLAGYTEESGTPVKMVSVRWEDFYQRVPAAVQSGKGPDVAIMHVDQIATSAADDVLRPLDDIAEELGLQESDFAPDVWNASVYRDRRYGIPLDMHPLALYFNKGRAGGGRARPRARSASGARSTSRRRSAGSGRTPSTSTPARSSPTTCCSGWSTTTTRWRAGWSATA